MTRAQTAVIVALRQGPGSVAAVLDRAPDRPRHMLREAVGQLVHTGDIVLHDDLTTISLDPRVWP